MKKITAAVVIINKHGDILGCHATGQPKDTRFDFPKGIVEEGESDICAALRELREETGIILQETDLIDCGIHKHNKEKDIHIFMFKTENMPDVNTLVCSSFFEYTDKISNETKELTECDFFEIIPPQHRFKFNKVLYNKFEIIDKINNA